MIAIRCELLLGSYQAADPFGSADDIEWPPHPYRLHAALVAAACEMGGEQPDAEAVEALRWLEAQGQPKISCSERPSRRAIGRSWVPRNPTRGGEWQRYMKAGSAINRVDRTFPTAVPEDPVVTFAWPDAESPPERLAALVESVTWLGSSRSPVVCAVVGDPPTPTLVPSARGHRQLRVAAPGLTEALLKARFIHPQPVSPPIAGYARHATEPAEVPPTTEGPFSELLVRRLVAPTQDAADAALLGAALRAAVLSCAGDDAPPALHGHDPDRGHAAYLALADVAHTGARGTVRGVALAVPADCTPEEAEACRRAFGAVNPLVLPDGRRPLRLDEADGLWTLSAERWVGPSTDWATVTPVILDRFPRRGRSPEEELVASIVNAGFPEPEEVLLLAGPPLRGAPPAGALRGEMPPGMRVHARVRFAAPVRGPLLAGRGRFRGVGCFLPERRT